VTESPIVRLPPLLGRQDESWRALVEIATQLGRHWLLVGGQMVFLHEVERQASETRPTDDVDVVVDLRVRPGGLTHVHHVLIRSGFEQSMPSKDGIAHRYRRAGATIDVLAPDDLGRRAPLTLGIGRTIRAPGASQALARSSTIRVALPDGAVAPVRRPTLVGALLGKVAATTQVGWQSPADRAKHLRDVDSLARLLGPADRHEADLTHRERAALERTALLPDLSPLGQRALTVLASSAGGPTGP
jgi:hypothetical protein